METHKIFTYLDNILDTYREPIVRVDGLISGNNSLIDTYSTSTARVSGLLRNPKEIIKTVEFYSNSQYLSGNRDALGREKPFYNIGNYRVTVAKTATDIDVKDIRYEPESIHDSIPAMLINHELFKYLKSSNFSLTLNEFGFTRPKYGGVLLKKSMDNGKLKIEVCDWTNMDFDPGDILGGTLIETYRLQPSKLAEKQGVWENVDIVLKEHSKLNKGKPAKIEVKQVTGDFPEEFYPENENQADYKFDGKYARMCFYIAIVGKKKYLLWYEYQSDLDYKYLAWEKVGDGLGRGVWEDGFESQVWQNDSMISMKNAMELSGKVILYTDSQKIEGNVITGVDNGHVFQLEQGRTVGSLNLSASALPQFEKIIELWNNQYDRAASTYDANTGEAPPAGTPYSQTALLNQVANSPFEYRREEAGIFLNEVLNDWLFPYLKKQILKPHYLVSEFSDDELQLIDESIANFHSNNALFDQLMGDGPTPTPQDQQEMITGIKGQLQKHGKKREIEIPKGYLDVEGRITANITGELKNKAAILQSLDGIFKTVVSSFNPATGQYAALQDPFLSKLLGQIVEMSGVSLTSAQIQSSSNQGGQPMPTAQPGMQTSPVQTADLSAIQPK
jgi:hypothetical protein